MKQCTFTLLPPYMYLKAMRTFSKISLLFNFRGRKQLLFLEVLKKDETRTVQVIQMIKLK